MLSSSSFLRRLLWLLLFSFLQDKQIPDIYTIHTSNKIVRGLLLQYYSYEICTKATLKPGFMKYFINNMLVAPSARLNAYSESSLYIAALPSSHLRQWNSLPITLRTQPDFGSQKVSTSLFKLIIIFSLVPAQWNIFL